MLPALLLIAAAHGSLTFIEDDYPKALAAARSTHRPLFIDFWATWCHSCLSMQRFVLSDPGMGPVADAVVWTSVETERERNKAVVEKYPVDAWPTFLIVDPESGAVLGRFLGSGTVQDLRAFVQDGVRGYHEKGRAADPAWAAQREGDAARNRGDLQATAAAYGRAVKLSKPDDPQRPERLNLYLSALNRSKEYRTCVRTGLLEARNTPASALGADFQSHAYSCAEKLPKGDAEAARMHELAIARLREILARDDAPLAPDDRSDALASLSEMLDAKGAHPEALAAMRQRAEVLEKAAAAAPDATLASTFDAHRTETYLYLGEPAKAERLLAQREKEMPEDYNPPARLARVLFEEKKLEAAEAAVDRALAKMDRGQRRVGILALKANILQAEGKSTTAVLREQLDVLRSLPRTQRRPEQERAIERTLASAQR
ncbi:MAG TPA: thioredoxin family protein [Myxococcales bacterium]|nr:thioredoxin family protein [Myxococcales bacterium]